MAAREFGFICHGFSVGESEGRVLPGAEGSYLPRSLMPGVDPAEISGRYLMRIYCKGSVVCNAKVEVEWEAHAKQAEPVLGVKVEDAAKLNEALGKALGKDVEIRFIPIS